MCNHGYWLVLEHRCCVVDELLSKGVPALGLTMYLFVYCFISYYNYVVSCFVCVGVSQSLWRNVVDGLLSKGVPVLGPHLVRHPPYCPARVYMQTTF